MEGEGNLSWTFVVALEERFFEGVIFGPTKCPESKMCKTNKNPWPLTQHPYYCLAFVNIKELFVLSVLTLFLPKKKDRSGISFQFSDGFHRAFLEGRSFGNRFGLFFVQDLNGFSRPDYSGDHYESYWIKLKLLGFYGQCDEFSQIWRWRRRFRLERHKWMTM